MSVETAADRKKDEMYAILKVAADSLREASKLAGEIISPNTWGGDEWSESFVTKMEDAEIDLIKMARDIDKITH